VVLIVVGWGYRLWSDDSPGWNHPDEIAGVLNDDMLRSAGKSAFIITREWDFYSPWIYNHYVNYLRPDLTMVDKELCRRSWYLNYIQKRHPEFDGIKDEFEAFLAALYPFEHKQKYNSAQLSRLYDNLLNIILKTRFKMGPIYATFSSDPELTDSYHPVPEGLLFRLYDDNGYHQFSTPALELEGKIVAGKTHLQKNRELIGFYSMMMQNRLRYLATMGDFDSANKFKTRVDNLAFKLELD
jgi:hypothetical protein